MKKTKLFMLAGVITILSFSFLTGCGDDRDDDDRLEAQIEQLEQQVTDLQKKNTNNTSGTNTANSTNTEKSTGQNANSTLGDITKIEEAVNAVVTKVDGTTPSGTSAEQMEQFFSLKREIEQLDRELDIYDDALEAQYRQGTLTREDYTAQERNVDGLENRLDNAEDKLEIMFGIDD